MAFPRHSASLALILVHAMTVLLTHPAAAQTPPFEMTRLLAHWADYGDEDYLPFVADARSEVVQLGFYGAHFWSLAHTPHGNGYPAHFPVQGHAECGEWFASRNAQLHRQGVKVIGHMNVKFLVGDPESDEGSRGFFDFYKNHWNESLLGIKPVQDPRELLEIDKNGEPISASSYSIGGMREYWACLNNPAWREILKRWVRVGIDRGLDGFIVNYFYRHDCHCKHCQAAFRRYLSERFSPVELARLGIADLANHTFDEIGSWHEPAQSTPLKREALRFSQIANKQAFDEVFIDYGRQLKPNLIVAQWNHLGDFSQISGDERCLLPTELWARGEDYLWYSTGGSANTTDLANGKLGEATLQARYIRGASGNKPFTLGKYEHVRVRTAIAELAANGGTPMGFYTNFRDPLARDEIARYYQFLHTHARLYHQNSPAAEAVLVFPRRAIHRGELEALERFKTIGRKLLDQHVLFDILVDDQLTADTRAKYRAVIDPSAMADTTLNLPAGLSRFAAPSTTRVSASRPAEFDEWTLHFVNYQRHELPDKSMGSGIQDEKPMPTSPFNIDVNLPEHRQVEKVEFLTPERTQSQELTFAQKDGRLQTAIPSFLVYGVLRIHLQEIQSSMSERPLRVAAIVTEYRHNSHADIILSRLLQTDTLDGQGRQSPLELASLYVDQRPSSDTSRMLAASHGFRRSDTIADALTLGTDQLAVDGVLLIAEHGDYPRSTTSNIQYPKRRFWDEIVTVFRKSNRITPVFIDKHLADNWEDAKWIYDEAKSLQIPLLAGSSVPLTWRRPATDLRAGEPLKEIVTLTYHTTDAYGFHALELSQALAEQRAGGEQGIRQVQTVTGEQVWQVLASGEVDRELLKQAWERLAQPGCRVDEIEQRVAQPKLLKVHYVDGLRLHLLELNGAVNEWSAAWRYADGYSDSTLAWTQEGRPGMHFSYLLQGIEQLIHTKRPPWNAERTLLTSGTLDALLISQTEHNRVVTTDYLHVPYRPIWRWQEPPYPPPMRPWSEQ